MFAGTDHSQRRGISQVLLHIYPRIRCFVYGVMCHPRSAGSSFRYRGNTFICVYTLCDDYLLQLAAAECVLQKMSHIAGLTTPFFFWHIPVWNVFRSVYDPLIGHMNGRVALPVYFICLTLVAELSNVVFGRVEVGLKKDLLEGG